MIPELQLEEFLAQYQLKVDEVAAREERGQSWPDDMKHYALRFAAWMSGTPDWWKLGIRDRVNTCK